MEKTTRLSQMLDSAMIVPESSTPEGKMDAGQRQRRPTGEFPSKKNRSGPLEVANHLTFVHHMN